MAFAAIAPATSEAALYWNQQYENVARANGDGSQLDFSFVAQPQAQLLGVAAGSGHLYWTSAWNDHFSISRSDLDGTHVISDFINLGSAYAPGDIAVDSAHIYWVVTTSPEEVGSIARANLDGSGVDLHFITAPDRPAGVAVDAGHVYWTNYFPGLIGRADLDGTNVVSDLVAGDTGKLGLAVDGGHLYWANDGLDSIGRADLDGSNANESFITGPVGPSDVAVDSGHLFWSTNPVAGFIGRAGLDGTGVEPHFIGGVSATSLALDGTAVTDTSVAARVRARATQQQARAVAIKVRVNASESIAARVTGSVGGRWALAPKSARLSAGEGKTLTLRLKHKSAQPALLRKLGAGPLGAKLKVVLTDDAGNRSSRQLSIKLTR